MGCLFDTGILVLTTLYYVLPGMVGNMMPVLVRNHFNFLDIPVDFNKRLGKKKIFGRHKTYRGFVFAMLGGALVCYVQFLLYSKGIFLSIAYVDYMSINYVFAGALFAFFALFGDLVRSFFKRRAGIGEGRPFFPWDQLDYAAGIIVAALFIKPMTWQMIAALLILAPFLSLMISRIGYFLKIRSEKW